MNQRSTSYRFVSHLLFLILFLLGSALTFWKCRYGFANIDESFYLTIPYRLYQGDALFAHEWHLSQMSAVFLYPFVALYHRFIGNLDGIVLASRYLFTVCTVFTALFVFFRFKQHHFFGATIASVCLLLFAPYGVMALSYNSIGILSLLIACILLFMTIWKSSVISMPSPKRTTESCSFPQTRSTI